MLDIHVTLKLRHGRTVNHYSRHYNEPVLSQDPTNLEIIDKDTSLIIVLPNQINHQSRVINPQFSSRDYGLKSNGPNLQSSHFNHCCKPPDYTLKVIGLRGWQTNLVCTHRDVILTLAVPAPWDPFLVI